MFFDTYGDTSKPTLVLLHGAALLDTFSHQYDALIEHFHVLVPHLPGAGEAAAEPYDPQAVSDALAVWIASLGIGKVAIMGHSIGGQLAVKLVSEHPALFSRAVFLSAWVCSTEASARFFAATAKMSYSAIKNAKLLRMQAKYWDLSPEQTDKLVSYSPRIPLETYVGFYENRVHLSALSGYADVQVPMLAMCARGETGQMKASLRALGEQNTNCLTVLFPQGSHDFVLQKHKLVNPILVDFLTANEA